MSKYRKLTYVVYRCDYHIVFVPKYRFRVLTGAIAELVEHDSRALSECKEVEVWEPAVRPDHVHLVCSIPPKVSVSQCMGLLKGELAREVIGEFIERYNQGWLLERHGHRTPAEVRQQLTRKAA